MSVFTKLNVCVIFLFETVNTKDKNENKKEQTETVSFTSNKSNVHTLLLNRKC